ncbi:MAG: hypothetical protein JRJ19_06765 [Deltaproteobacteria bacterium]|nr:hypothetical protein [Deltaproteobacteria bacterium]MBW1871747.1 hypothetical protein [Deltaproteobacteria bacterium]
MRKRFEAVGICLALVLSSAASLDCGDSLCSLDSVQRSSRDVYAMELNPDFGRRGSTVLVVVEKFDSELDQLLVDAVAYPTEIYFGEGTFIKSFGTNEEDKLEIEVFVSPLATEGEREPTLVFSVNDRLVEARGRFWILPAQPE